MKDTLSSLRIAKLLIDAGVDQTIPGWTLIAALCQAQNRKRGDRPKVYDLLIHAARKPRQSRSQRREG